MSPRDVASLAFKLAGIYLIVQPLAPLGELLSFLAIDQRHLDDAGLHLPWWIAGRLLPVAVGFILGVLLITKSRFFAGATIRDVTGGSRGIRPVDLHAILFSVAGALLIGLASTSIPHLLYDLAEAVSEYREPFAADRRMALLANAWTWTTGVVLQFGIGVGLLFGGRRLASLFHRPHARAEEPAPTGLCPRCGHPFFAEDYKNDGSTRLCSKCRTELPAELFPAGA